MCWAQSGAVSGWSMAWAEFGEGVAGSVQVFGQDLGCGGGGGEADHGAAAVGPGVAQDGESGGLAGAGGCDRELEAASGGGEVTDQRSLAGVEGGAVGDRFQQGEVDQGRVDAAAVGSGGGGEQAAFSGEDAAGAVGG